MSKKGCLVVAVLLCLCFCTACGGKTGNEDVQPTEKLRAEWHKLVKPVTDEDYLGAVKKSRELHESLFPKEEIAPLGSGKSKEEANGELYAFGDSNAKSLTEIDLHTDLPLTGWTDAASILLLLEPERVWKERYNGMYDDAVLEKINTRIATVVEGMADPSFYPEVEGLVSLLQERGLPRNDVTEYECYNEKGILSVEVNRTWSWYDWKETDEYSEEDYDYIKSQWPDGDYRYTFSELFYSGQDSSYTIVQYQIYESVGLTFDLTTGEELRLSDLFPAGEDYLSYLNTQIVAQMGQGYDEGSPFSGLRGDETFYLTVGREDSVVICFPGILREIGVSVEVPIPRFEETTEPETTGTPDPEKMSLEELIARNRELHKAVSPKVTVHPLGTAPLPSGQEKQDLAYGITRAGSAAVTSVDMETGEEFSFDSNWDYSRSFYLHIDGLKDAKMQKLVNERLESVARDMQDRGFLPSAAGIMPYIKAWGLPKGAVHEYAEYNEKGILSVHLDKYWYWEEERTFADDSAFQDFRDNLDWPYGFNYEITDGYWFIWNSPVKLRYSLTESFYLNINLATGEDLALSDVFPEGYDYLSELNKKIDRDYDYWFFHDDPDSSDWQRYDPTQEYDGGSAKNAIAGDEMFFLTRDVLYVETKWGDRVSLGWSSDRIAAKSTGESVYSDTSILRVGPAETVEFAGYIWRVKDYDKIGSFTAEQGGSKHAVSVYSDRDYLQWMIGGDSENAFFEAAVKLFTDEAIVAFAKQAFERGLVYCGSASGCDIMLMDVGVYGNGCYLTHWRTDAVGADADDVVNKDDYVWIWDGECHNSVDLLDTPYADLMTDIILTLYWEDSEGSQSVVADREEAEDLVKALMCFTHGSGGSQETPITHITWQNYTFRLGEDGEVCIEPDFLSADSPWQELSVLEPYLPAPLWEKLDGALHRYRKLKCSDPFVITKQLRMYEGYSFE